MTTKKPLTILVGLLAALLIISAAVAIQAPALVGPHAPPATAGTPANADVTIAAQKARLALSDGRAATFVFTSTAGTLTAHAAVGLDQECNYALLPLAELPSPAPTPGPTPDPEPKPQPQTSNLRVLFTYDPTSLADLPLPQQAILASPVLRSYLEKHCPVESNCASGSCPLNAGHSASYRFLPAVADVAQLPAVWQGIFHAVRDKPAPWLLVVNEAGQTVVDQSWPGSVEETLSLLQKYGGQ
jgi:hypothetical protein